MIITKTPLRLSLLGGNTDFPKYFKKYGGAVLTTTIDKYIYCIVKKRFDKQIWVNYSEKETVTSVNEIKHDLVREAMKLVGIENGIEITFLSDIVSEGSGLGSSSAVTVGVLNALHQYVGDAVSKKQLAEEACRIEIDILKKPIGIQDQYAVAYGGTNLMYFKNEITIQPINPNTLEDQLMLFYTDKTRKAESVLRGIKLKRTILKENTQLAFMGAGDIASGAHYFAGFLHDYWQMKKLLNPKATDPYIDKLYMKALAAGAKGGKIVGAGGGGFLLLSVPWHKKDDVRVALNLRELPFHFSQQGSHIIFNYE